MAETFPSTLQDKVNEAGFEHGFGETAIRSTMGIGLDKVRQRFTKGIDVFSVTITLDLDEYSTLYNFFKTTLAGGSLTFNYDHPFTAVEEEFRFTSPPRMIPMGGRYVQVSMTWEQIP
jgi:phage-related protein